MTDNTPKVSFRDEFAKLIGILNHYVLLWFVLLLVAVYGFVTYRIETAHNAEPSDTDISTQVQATATPRIDATTVEQMQSLQDHSVNVKTLFDQARSNPFQE